MRPIVILVLTLAAALAPARAADRPTFGAELEGFAYPHEVRRHAFESQGQALSMAYMDVAPERPNGRTAVLLHGKNFCAATWEGVVGPLSAAGYRVLAPDQIGFCKSSKPRAYQYSLHQLAANTRALADRAGAGPVTLIGHSMGGMLAVRYALMYPEGVERLVLVNPIGLEDWQAEGVPPQSVDALYRTELKTDFARIKRYQQTTYYAGTWRPAYDRWVEMLAGQYAGPGRETVAWSQALTADMVFTQPVVHELERVAPTTLLMIGGRDTTAIGKDRAPPAVAERLGDYAELGRRAAARVPDATLVPFPDLGHSPHIQAPDRFNAALLRHLEAPPAR